MKKLSIILILVLVLSMSVVLTACSSSSEANRTIRWTEESYTYNVTMQPLEIDDAVEFDSNEFVSVTELVSYGEIDQITPSDVSGTYTTNLVQDGDNWVYTTVLTLHETYSTSDETTGGYVSSFVNGLTTQQTADLVEETTTDAVTLLSVTTTSVTFANDYLQTPVQSTKVVSGYYLGETNQQSVTMDIKCVYSDNTATVTGTINDNTVSTSTDLDDNTIDVNQLTLYARSLDQSESFSTSATATVYSPETDTSASVTFDLLVEYYLYLDIEEDGNRDYATVTYINITIDSTYVAYCLYNNPSDTMSSSSSSTGLLNKYTTVMFQSGIYVFQFDSYYSLYNDLAYTES